MLIHYSLTVLLPLTLMNVVLHSHQGVARPQTMYKTVQPAGSEQPNSGSPPPVVQCLCNMVTGDCCGPVEADNNTKIQARSYSEGNDAPSSNTTAPSMPSNSPQARSVPSHTAVTRRSVSGTSPLQLRNVVEARDASPAEAPSPAEPASTVPAPTPLPQPRTSARRRA